MSKLVTIIIPTYKRVSTLERTINSAINQSYKNIEIIVVDDNQPDSIYRLEVENLVRTYTGMKNFIYIKHPKNLNGAAARNTGLVHSNGDYITFLDDDDIFYETKVEKQVKYLENQSKHGCVYCGRVQNNQVILGNYEGNLTKQLLSMSFTPTTPCLMFKKSTLLEINGFNPTFKRHQDYELLLRYFEKYTIGYIYEPLVEIGVNEGENQLKTDELLNMKINYLHLFERKILEIDAFEKGFYNKTYRKHLSTAIISFIKYKGLLSAIKQSLRFKKFGLIRLWINILSSIITGVTIRRRRKKSDIKKRKN